MDASELVPELFGDDGELIKFGGTPVEEWRIFKDLLKKTLHLVYVVGTGTDRSGNRFWACRVNNSGSGFVDLNRRKISISFDFLPSQQQRSYETTEINGKRVIIRRTW